MNKLILCFSIFLTIFLIGCANIKIDSKDRISGIISACKSNPKGMSEYLKCKVKNKQISQLVSYTIQECLTNE